MTICGYCEAEMVTNRYDGSAATVARWRFVTRHRARSFWDAIERSNCSAFILRKREYADQRRTV